jgi:molecular chaperone GrpE
MRLVNDDQGGAMTRIPIDDENTGTTEAPDGAEPQGQGQGQGLGQADEATLLRAERDSMFERLARATADFQNTRKRLEAEADQRVQYANSALIKSLLPVIDNFERALAMDPAKVDAAAILKGMQIVHDQWLKVLRDQKVEEIAPQPGEPFDPNRHEALMQQPGNYAEPTVTQLLQKGYALHGRTLRPAQVAVSKTS